jgi:hypothetical protein
MFIVTRMGPDSGDQPNLRHTFLIERLVISLHLSQRKRFGRPSSSALRSIVDALLYMARTGCVVRRFNPQVDERRAIYPSPSGGPSLSKVGKS